MRDFIAITGAACIAYMSAWLEDSRQRDQNIHRSYL